MNRKRLIFRNLRHFRKAYFAVLGGAVISIAVLSGALSVGDSVRFSLRQLTETRLGKTRFVVQSSDHLFSDSLAGALSAEIQCPVAPLLVTEGIAVNSDNGKRINRAVINGIDQRFSQFRDGPAFMPAEDEAIISRNTAEKLGLSAGDEFLLRIRKEGNTPRNAPFAAEKSISVPLRLKVGMILDDESGGRFSLKTNQSAPFNIFISLAQLNKILDLKGKSNLLLTGSMPPGLDIHGMDSLLQKIWKPADAGLKVRKMEPSGMFEITSERIFIDDTISAAVRSVIPGTEGLLTYLANTIRSKNGSTPYSFVTAGDSSFFGGKAIPPCGIIINQWLAEDLHAGKGDSLTLRYFIMGDHGSLSEDSARFVISSVIAMNDPLCDPLLMPDFPGMSDAGSCRDWETSAPIDLKRIRDKDEQYWNEYRGTPKAFISLSTGRELWKNRFGGCTAIRFKATNDKVSIYTKEITSRLKPSENGLRYIPVFEQGTAAASGSTDFGQLFLGLSFLIIISGLLLMAMVFSVHLRSRLKEAGILSATGFRKSAVMQILLAECTVIALVAGLIGSLLGIAYDWLMLLGLNTLWRDSVHISSLRLHLHFSTIITGAATGIFITILVLAVILWRSLKEPTVNLLRGSSGRSILKRKARHTINPRFPGFMSLVLKNAGLNRRRTAGAIVLLAIGTFTIIVTGANRRSFPANDHERRSGTGGFLAWAESTIPVTENLNHGEGRKMLLKANEALFRDARFAQLPVLEGNDASCLNLNRVTQPTLLGVDAAYFNSISAFSFAELDPAVQKDHPWNILKKPLSEDVIPGVADQTVIKWSLGLSVGDTVVYADESGRPLKIKLVGGLDNSIFQGNILISDSLFRLFFPSVAGSKVMLVDGPYPAREDIVNEMESIFTDLGMVVTPASQRLDDFNAVQNTYLMVFMMLGGLGVIIGTFGLGFLLIRNMIDRRSELAIYLATGFSKNFVIRLLITEHLLILGTGVVAGIIASLTLLIPGLLAPGSMFPFLFTGIILLIVLVTGILWIIFPVRAGMKKELVAVLREGE